MMQAGSMLNELTSWWPPPFTVCPVLMPLASLGACVRSPKGTQRPRHADALARSSDDPQGTFVTLHCFFLLADGAGGHACKAESAHTGKTASQPVITVKAVVTDLTFKTPPSPQKISIASKHLQIAVALGTVCCAHPRLHTTRAP